jgi:subtilisin-like proprotein convertase family protein
MKSILALTCLFALNVASAETKDGTPDVSSVNTPDGTCQPIPDNAYIGGAFTAGQAACKTFSTGTGTINNLQLNLGITHTWVGDLVIKVQNPAATKTVTLVSRAGFLEPDDTGVSPGTGDSSNLLNTSPISFADAFVPSAETMGSVPALTSAQTICLDLASPCNYKPDPGATVPANPLSAFNGDTAGPGWTICVGDRAPLDTGDFCSVSAGTGGGGGTPTLTIAGGGAVSFGAVVVGGSATGTATMSNTGTAPLSVTAIAAPTAPFTRSGGTCAATPFTLAAAANCTVTYTFTPTAIGSATQTLAVASNGGNGNIVLSATALGVAVPAPSLNIAGMLAMILALSAAGLIATRRFS